MGMSVTYKWSRHPANRNYELDYNIFEVFETNVHGLATISIWKTLKNCAKLGANLCLESMNYAL